VKTSLSTHLQLSQMVFSRIHIFVVCWFLLKVLEVLLSIFERSVGLLDVVVVVAAVDGEYRC
jgi:hypothetical protein